MWFVSAPVTPSFDARVIARAHAGEELDSNGTRDLRWNAAAKLA